ncbi:hypothetical protein BX600DRAFT_502266 [Xylariales sp. PMI_506]|nr:hypothetical protein BX600DRAFT_502266 [Xylariales sp. PMI_506]
MADPLSVSGLVTGIVSLGLQVCGGVLDYLDALKCRTQEIAAAKRYVQNLEILIQAIKSSSARAQSQDAAVNTALRTCLESCDMQLKALDSLIGELTGANTTITDWVQRAKQQKKKLSYAFDRTKVARVEARLSPAIDALQIAIQTLGIDISNSVNGRLITLESATNHSLAELRHVKSHTVELKTTMNQMNNELSKMRGSVEGLVPVIIQTKGEMCAQIVEGTYATWQTHDSVEAVVRSIHTRYNELEASQQSENSQIIQMLKEMGLAHAAPRKDGRQKITPETVLKRALSKPSVLDGCYRQLNECSVVGQPTSPPKHLCLAEDHTKNLAERYALAQLDKYDKCNCMSRRRSIKRKIRWGPLEAFDEATIYQRHLPTCPASKFTDRNTRTFGLRYQGITQLLGKAVEISFQMATGAGGRSLGPRLTTYSTVDQSTAPAFRLVSMLQEIAIISTRKDRTNDMYIAMNTCKTLIEQLFRNGKASPTDVNWCNQSLLHAAADVPFYVSECDTAIQNAFSELLRMLLRYNVPVGLYDSNGLMKSQHESVLFAEALDCGPLSRAIIKNDLQQVAYHLQKHPHSLNEKNVLGQTPLHLSIYKPQLLRLIIKNADKDLLNEADEQGFTALDYAVISSKELCVNEEFGPHCRRCHCAKAASVLLKADCAVMVRPRYFADILKFCSKRCRKRYLKHLKNRRQRLEQLAISHLSYSDICTMGLDRGSILDVHALQTYETLTRKGIPIPAALRLRATSVSEAWDSVYHYANISIYANQLFNLGFRDLDALNDEALPPLMSASGWDIDYVNWLVERGADLFRELNPTSKTPARYRTRGAMPAHYFYRKVGLHQEYCLKDSYSIWNSSTIDGFYKLNKRIVQKNPTDGCICNCSSQGCTPFVFLLNSMIGSHNESGGSAYLSTGFKLFLGYIRYFDRLALQQHVDAVRYLTHHSLDLVHTCCSNGCITRDGSPTDEFVLDPGDQDADDSELLEILITEFEVKINKIMENNRDTSVLRLEFWEGYWYNRMREELKKLESRTLSDEQIRAAEEIGIVWETFGPEAPPEVEHGEEYDSLDYWLRRMEKIVAD